MEKGGFWENNWANEGRPPPPPPPPLYPSLMCTPAQPASLSFGRTELTAAFEKKLAEILTAENFAVSAAQIRLELHIFCRELHAENALVFFVFLLFCFLSMSPPFSLFLTPPPLHVGLLWFLKTCLVTIGSDFILTVVLTSYMLKAFEWNETEQQHHY